MTATLTCALDTLEVTMEQAMPGTTLTVTDTRPGGWFRAQTFIANASAWDLLPLLDVLADDECCLAMLDRAVEKLSNTL